MSDGRTLAPFGRRRAPVTGVERHGAYAVLSVADADGPAPDPGQFYMLAAAERWGGGADERPFLPRAFSVMRAHAGGRLDFLLEDVGPGTARLAELAPGRGRLAARPARPRLRRPARRPPADPRRAAAWGSPRSRPGPTRSARRRSCCSASAMRSTPRGRRCIPGARVATDDGSRGHRGLVTELLAAELGGDPRAEVYACGPPPMLEAVRAMCAEHGVPAQLALESGMACGFGACFGCVVPTRTGYVRLCVDGPVLDAAELGGGRMRPPERVP